METPDTVTAGITLALKAAVLNTALRHGGQPPFGLMVVASMANTAEFAVLPTWTSIVPTAKAGVARMPGAFLVALAFPYRTRVSREERLALVIARADAPQHSSAYRLELSPVNPALHDVGALEDYLTPDLTHLWGRAAVV